MKHILKCKSLLMATAITMVLGVALAGTAFADLSASDIVASFNSLNNNKGWRFTTPLSSGAKITELTTASGYEDANVTAYDPRTGGNTSNGASWFETFCLEPMAQVDTTGMYAKLNYENNRTTTSEGSILSLGSAYLYKMYATGTLTGFNYAGTSTDFDILDAIRRISVIGFVHNDWSNTFLTALLNIKNDKNYWLAAYDPGQYYDELGDYKVFVMNVTSIGGADRQDYLYLASTATETPPPTNNDVPEPAMLLLWTLGGLGAAGTAWARKRKMKKLA